MKIKIILVCIAFSLIVLSACNSFRENPSVTFPNISSTTIENNNMTDRLDSETDYVNSEEGASDQTIASSETTVDNSVSSIVTTDENTLPSDTNTDNTTDALISSSTNAAQPNTTACTHHRTSGDVLVRTVTWTEDATHLIWTCTQCGASGKDLKVTTETPSTDTGATADTVTDTPTDTSSSAETSKPSSPYAVLATANTADLLAERMVYYINKYREEEGSAVATVLSGLTDFCRCRSLQLVNNFEHNTRDIRSAATALEYGRYTDPTEYGFEGEPFYEPPGQEAIVRCSMYSPKTVDEMAKKLTDSLRNSQSHWNYLGAKIAHYVSYNYIAAGACFDNGVWYCCIYVADTDIYG